MADDRMAGTLRNAGGKVQEGFGKVTGDTTTEIKGAMNQAAGAVQEVYGKTKDVAVEGAQMVKDVAIDGHDVLRRFIEDRPHTAAAVALGIGILIGYTAHRPPTRRSYWWE